MGHVSGASKGDKKNGKMNECKVGTMRCTYLFGAGSADVGAEHDKVGGFAMHVFALEAAVKDFQVATAAIDVLFMLDRELDDEGFVAITEWLKFG